MHYIFKNLKQFISKNTMIFILFIVCQIVSFLILFLSYGVYMNYRETTDVDLLSKEGLYDSVTGEKYKENSMLYMLFSLNFKTEKTPTYGECKDYFYTLMDEFGSKLDYINAHCWVRRITPEEIFEEIDTGRTKYNPMTVYLVFAKRNGEYAFADTTDHKTVDSQGLLRSGRWFTEDEFINGDALCIANLGNIKNDTSENLYIRDEGSDTYVYICKKPYKVIGTAGSNEYAMKGGPGSTFIQIPFLNAPDDLYLGDGMSIKFTEPLTTDEYNRYYALTDQYFSDCIDDEFGIPKMAMANIDKQYFYNTNLWISLIIAVGAGINLAALYRYVLVSRRKTLAIFRMSGATKNRARRIYIAESIGISAVVFWISAAVFRLFGQSWLVKYYPNSETVFTAKLYLIMFGIYIAAAYLIMNLMIIRSVSKTPVGLVRKEV